MSYIGKQFIKTLSNKESVIKEVLGEGKTHFLVKTLRHFCSHNIGRETAINKNFFIGPNAIYKPYIPPKKGWINIDKDNQLGGSIHPTKEKANQVAGNRRIACIEIEYYERQGLDGETQ